MTEAPVQNPARFPNKIALRNYAAESRKKWRGKVVSGEWLEKDIESVLME
jgi:hypothetical protein